MSWLFSRALVEAFSEATCSDGARSALSSGSPTPRAFLSPDRTTAFSRPSRFGMTFGPLTDALGAELLTWFLAASRAKRSAAQPEALTRRKTFGRKCGESWQMSLPGVSLPRTWRQGQSIRRRTTSRRWATKPVHYPCPRQTWVLITKGRDFGYLHTPTATANYSAPSMQKWPCARRYRQVFGKPSPTNHEWLMGWPIGWTDLRPLEMDRFHSWLLAHSLRSVDRWDKEAA